MTGEYNLRHYARILSWRPITASIALTLMLALAAFTVTARSTHGYVVWSDGFAYFVYARSFVIDHDLDITDEVNDLDQRFPPKSEAIGSLRKWANRDSHGSVRPPWPAGSGMVMAPFYALGYAAERVVAWMAGRPADSYGLIAQYGFCLGSAAFGLLGIWCLVLMCREVAEKQFSYLAAVGVATAGPVIFYMLVHPSMSHASSFGLAALATLLWLIAWKHGGTLRSTLAIGLLIGVAATVRYQNALFAILPAALVLKYWKEHGLGTATRHAVAGGVALLIPIGLLLSSQLHISTPDSTAGVTLAHYPVDLSSPYFAEVMLSCRHGAFHWAPLLAIGMLGLLWAALSKNGWAAVLLLTLLTQVYLIGGLGLSNLALTDHPPAPGWLHRWDDTPSFGMRYLTECAPIFALGLAYLMQRVPSSRIPPAAWGAGIALFACWNGLLIVAYGLETITRSGCLPYADMFTGVEEVFRRLSARL